MDPIEMEATDSGTVQGKEDSNETATKKKKTRTKYSYLPKFGCLRIEEDKEGNFDIEVDTVEGERPTPTHLVIMVNGIIGSAEDWKFAAKQLLKKYPRDVVVHCSESNSLMLTFDGVDRMGARLAAEVITVIKRHPSVQKISFVSHSLGGLISRYAIAKLYGQDVAKEISQENGDCESNLSGDASVEDNFKCRIAGLEPVNFITFATPHLGSRGHKQVPVFCGSYALEKAASRISGCLGRTGKHLFLTDTKNGKPPLLLQMASDSEDLKFISALQCFKRRIAYANAHFDSLVGWSTSSLRHRKELPKRRHLLRDDKYRHIVLLDTSKFGNSQKAAPAEVEVDEGKAIDMEEEMLRSLKKLSWERFDVKFRGTAQRFLAHNSIQVKSKCINSAGADVVQHMVDNFLL